MPLTLERASIIADAALAEGRKLKLAPLVVAVLDAGGHLLVFKREDGAGIMRFDIAFAKAWGSLGLGFGSRELTERAAKMPVFYAALASAASGRLAPSPGGVLISEGGTVIGAIGVSGDVGDQDEAAALAGAKAAGFEATGRAPA